MFPEGEARFQGKQHPEGDQYRRCPQFPNAQVLGHSMALTVFCRGVNELNIANPPLQKDAYWRQGMMITP
jgi:hypothetical protein